jgi:hypothetical protein
MANFADHSQGILVDLDMAQRVDTPQWREPPAGTDRNTAPVKRGTTAFKALDLLRDGSPQRLRYRHDLESFFYVLVWLVTQYEDGHPVVPPYIDISGWCFGADRHWSDMYRAKKVFLASEDLPCKHELARAWLPRLRQMFHSGYAAWDMIQEGPAREGSVARATNKFDVMAQKAVADPATLSHADSPFDVETLGGHVTYEKFIAILMDS